MSGYLHSGNFVLINSKDSLPLLKSILLNSTFPNNADVFTHELSLTGAKTGSMGRREIRKRSLRQASNLDKLIKPFIKIASDKSIRIWLGHVLLEDGKLFNAYSLVTKAGIAFTHRKRFLWRTEKWLFDRPEKWDGNFADYSILICSEASAFYDPLGWSRPTRIPELRQAEPKLVAIPAYWYYSRKHLLDIARSIATSLRSKTYGSYTCTQGVNPKGAFAAIINFSQCAIIGPAPKKTPRNKTKIRGFLKDPGWINFSGGFVEVVRV